MKNFLTLLLLLFSITCSYTANAAGCTATNYTSPNNPPPACGNNPMAGNTCDIAVPICDLNGYCGNTSPNYTVNTWSQLTSVFSNGCGSIENNSFLKFTAGSASMSMNVWLTHCECEEGIQIMVFSTAGNCSGAVTSHGCWSPGSASGGPAVVNITGLTVGQEYYVMIDGFNGDYCEYIIGVNGSNSGIALPPVVSPNIGTICLGESVNLAATQGDGNYTWDASTDLNVTTGANVTATPTSIGTHTYTVSSGTGNLNCATANPGISSAVITVEACCPAVAGNTGAVCVSEPFGLTTTIVDQTAVITSYSWTGPNGYTSSVANPTNVVINSAGSHTFTLTAMVNGQPCVSTTTIEISTCINGCDIDAIKTAYLNAGCIELPTCIQDCSLYFLNPQAMTGSQAQTFAQTLGSNLVSIQSLAENNCILTALNDINQTGTIWIGLSDELVEGTFVWYDQSPVTYTNWAVGEPNQSGNEDCVQIYPGGAYPGTWNDLSCTSSNSLSIIEVNLCPVVSTGPNISICQGETAVIQSGPTILGSQPYTYSWNNNGPTTFTNSVSPTVSTDYILTSTDRFGCVGKDTISVQVKNLPLMAGGNDITICEGNPITLNATGATGTWSGGVVNGVPFTPTTSGTYIYTAVVDNCTSTDTVQVTLKPTPGVSFVPDKLIGCSPLFINFDNQLIENGVTYTWNFGDGTIVNASGDTSHVYQGEGCADVSLTATLNGCTNVASYEDLICVEENPDASFTPIPSEVSLINPTTTFENHSTGATSYTWNFGDQSTYSNLFSPTHTFPNNDPGSYTVVLIAKTDLGCVDTAKFVVRVADEIIYYVPNAFTPDEDEFNPTFKPIFTAGFDPHDYSLLIFNRWGEPIFTSFDVEVGWDGTFSASKGRVQDGVYTWKIEFKTKRSDERKVLMGSVVLIK